MKKSIKWLFYFKHLIQMSTINKIRLTLTSIGIFIAVFLFSVGTIITNSYYTGSLKVISQMEKNTAIITSNLDTQKLKEELSFVKNFTCIDISTLAEKKTILSTKIDESQYLTVMSYVHGISSINHIMPVLTEDGAFIPVKASLLKGRAISQTDIQAAEKVAIIDELTEELLFPGSEGIGKYIELGVGVGNITIASNEAVSPIKLKIIGVVENSYSANLTKLMLKQEISKNSENIFANVSIYCPISTLINLFENDDKSKSYFYQIENSDLYDDFVKKSSTLSEIKNKTGGSLSVTTKEMLLNNLEQDLSNTKTLINMISLLLCIISGISIMSITFFSVKERIPEIGIRKAFGASKLDIAFQFVFEMVIIALIASVLAVLFSVISCVLLENFLTESLYMAFSTEISFDLLILPLFIGVFEAVVCSIIPSLYAAKIKVTDSLRFE